MSLKSAWAILKQSVSQFSEHRVVRLAAATAYYATFSIGPLLVLIIGIAGLVFGPQRVAQEVQQQLQGFVGTKSANLKGSFGGLVTGIVWRIKRLRRAVGTFSAIASGAVKKGRGSI